MSPELLNKAKSTYYIYYYAENSTETLMAPDFHNNYINEVCSSLVTDTQTERHTHTYTCSAHTHRMTTVILAHVPRIKHCIKICFMNSVQVYYS